MVVSEVDELLVGLLLVARGRRVQGVRSVAQVDVCERALQAELLRNCRVHRRGVDACLQVFFSQRFLVHRLYPVLSFGLILADPVFVFEAVDMILVVSVTIELVSLIGVFVNRVNRGLTIAHGTHRNKYSESICAHRSVGIWLDDYLLLEQLRGFCAHNFCTEARHTILPVGGEVRVGENRPALELEVYVCVQLLSCGVVFPELYLVKLVSR